MSTPRTPPANASPSAVRAQYRGRPPKRSFRIDSVRCCASQIAMWYSPSSPPIAAAPASSQRSSSTRRNVRVRDSAASHRRRLESWLANASPAIHRVNRSSAVDAGARSSTSSPSTGGSMTPMPRPDRVQQHTRWPSSTRRAAAMRSRTFVNRPALPRVRAHRVRHRGHDRRGTAAARRVPSADHDAALSARRSKSAPQRRSNSAAVQSLSGRPLVARLLALARSRSNGRSRK